MSICGDSNINKNYIVQSVDGSDIFSACTEFYTNQILPCSGNTVNINGNINVIGDVSGTTFYGDGSNLTGIISEDNYVSGGTYNDISKLLSFVGTNSATTFNISLSALSTEDNYVTGATYNTTGLTLDFVGTNTATTFSVNVSDIVFSGGSGNCISDFYVSNIYGCSPITIHDNLQNTGSTATGNFVNVFGSGNTSSSNYTLIGGGHKNTITGSTFSTIGGGSRNIITNSQHSFIGGGGFDGEGPGHEIANYSMYSFIGGGRTNTIRLNSRESVIAGGRYNKIETYSRRSFIGGGQDNEISGDSYLSVIGGGDTNLITNFSNSSSILNGFQNTIKDSSYYSTILGGKNNSINGFRYSTILGGQSNNVYHNNSHIIGSSITSVSANTTHIENLHIGVTPDEINSLENFLMRDINGMIRTRSYNSLASAFSADTFITGMTFNPLTYGLTAYLNDNTSTTPVSLAALASDVFVVSGVYNPSTGIVTYTNSTGGTFQVSGFTTGMTDSYTTNAYINGTQIRFDNNIQGNNYYNVDLLPLLSGKTNNTDFYSYTSSTQTILNGKIENASNVGGANELFKDKSGTTLNFRTLSGGSNTTISTIGDVVKIDVTIPPDTNTYVTGGTYNSGTTSIDYVGTVGFPSFSVNVSELLDNQNTYLTAFTYDNANTFTIVRNDNQTFVTTINTVTGLTVNGDLNVTGTTNLNVVNGNIFSGGTYYGDGSNLSGISTVDTYVTGVTFDNSTYILTIKQNNGQPDLTSNLSVLASDVYVLSGVYNPSTGIVTYTNSTGGTFQVSGFTTGMTDSYTIAANLTGETISFDNNIQGNNLYSVSLTPVLSGKTDLTLFNSHTGDTNNPHQTSFSNLTNTAHTHTLSDITDFSSYSGSVQTQLDSKIENGINVGGSNEIFSGKSGNDLYFRTLSGGSNTTISTIGDIVRVDVTIPPDTNTYVTGFTYDNSNTFTISRNDNVSLSATINVVTGFTINGNLEVTNNTILSGLSTYESLVSGTNPDEIVNVDYLTGYVQTNDIYVTGVTFSSNTLTLSRNDNNSISTTITESLKMKSGVVPATGFTGNPDTATITFGTPFNNNNYSITVTGEDSRSWTIESKTASGFTINSNANPSLAGNTFWQAIEIGEN